MKIRFAEEQDLAAVARFNDRLKAKGRDEQITLHPSLPGEAQYRPDGFPVYRRMMIAKDGDEVRAAMLLYYHNLFINGEKRDFCWTDMPLSEGIIDSNYSMAIIQLVKEALNYQPFLMALGVGTSDVKAYHFLIKLGWNLRTVPFFFYPVRATRVMLGLNYLKNRSSLRYAAMLGAYSGAAVGLSALLALRRRMTAGLSGSTYRVVGAFEDWADRVFENSLPNYGAAVRSDSTTLNIVYPPDHPDYVRLRVSRKGKGDDVGWIVVARKQMSDNPYFGDLNVGTLVDGFGRSADVPLLVAAGLDYLAGAGADLVVANFSHAAWAEACRGAGMFSSPSNYQLFVSPGGTPVLDDSCPLEKIHVARGHCDGMLALVDRVVRVATFFLYTFSGALEMPL